MLPLRQQAWMLLSIFALASIAGCDRSSLTNTQEKFDLEADHSAVRDLSAERWQIVDLQARRLYVAGVRGTAENGTMLVSCETPSDTLVASIVLPSHLSGDPSRRSVDLLFDEGGFASPNWTPRTQVDGTPSAFDIVYDKDYYTYAHAFWIHITNLEKHDVVVAVVREGGAEVSRYKFSLIGAKTTIDAVVRHCGQPKPW